MKYGGASRAGVVLCALASPALALQGGASVTFSGDFSEFPGLDEEALRDLVEDALETAGHSGEYTIGLARGDDGTLGSRSCDPANPSEGELQGTFELYPEAIRNAVADLSNPVNDGVITSTAEGRASVFATAAHEAAHDCYFSLGGNCSGHNGQGNACLELAADNAAAAALCKKVNEKCEEYCDKLVTADDPPSPEQQECLDELTDDVAALCKEHEGIRDRWDDEKANEKACLCQALGIPPPMSMCPDHTAGGGAGPGDNPPNGDGSYGDGDAELEQFPHCDYPNDTDHDTIPKCDKCDGCGCNLDQEEEPQDGGDDGAGGSGSGGE